MPSGSLISSSGITSSSTAPTARGHIATFSDAAKIAFWSTASGTFYAVKLSGGAWGAAVSISGTNYLAPNTGASAIAKVSDTITLWSLLPSGILTQIKLPWNAATHAMGTITTATVSGLSQTGTAVSSLDAVWNATYSYWYIAYTSTANSLLQSVTDALVLGHNYTLAAPATTVGVAAPSSTQLLVAIGFSTGTLRVYPVTMGTGGTITPSGSELVPSASMQYFAVTLDGSNLLDIVGGDGATTLGTVKRTGSSAYSAVTSLYNSSNNLTLQPLPALNFNSATGDLWAYFTTKANQANGEVYVAKRTSGSWTTPTLAVGGDSSGYQGVSCAAAWDATNGWADYLYLNATNALYYYNGITGSVPNTPTNTTPANAANTTTTPSFAFVYANPVASDAQLAYEIRVTAVSGGAVQWDSGKVTSGNASGIVYGAVSNTGDVNYVAPATLAFGTQYQWQVRVWDTVLNSVSAYSTTTTFTPQQGPNCSILSIASGTGATQSSTLASGSVINAGSVLAQTGQGSRFTPNNLINVGTGTVDAVMLGGINGDTLFAGKYSDFVIRGGVAPALYYRLDETSGTAATDSSGNGRSGLYTGGYTLNQSGAINDGTAGITISNKSLTYAAGTGLPVGSSDRTVAFWMKTAGANTGMPFCWGPQTALNFFGLNFTSTTNAAIDINSVSANITIASYNDSMWHHFVVTLSGTTVAIYKDGTLQGSATLGSTPNTTLGGGLIIGADPSGGNPFACNLDEFVIYSRVLSAGEITAHYNLGKNASGALTHAHSTGDAITQTIATTSNGTASSTLNGATLASATSLTVQTGKGSLFTNGQQVAVGVSPNIDLVTISGISGDTLTVGAMTHAHSNTDPVIQALNTVSLGSPTISWTLDYQQPNGHNSSQYSVLVYDSTGTTLLDSAGPVASAVAPGTSLAYANLSASHVVNGGTYKLAASVTDGTTGVSQQSAFWTATATYTSAASITSVVATPVPNSGWVQLNWLNTSAASVNVYRRLYGTSTWTTLSSGTLITQLKDFPAMGVAYDYGIQAVDSAGVPSAIVVASDITLTGKFAGHYAFWLNDVTAPATVNAAFGVVDDSKSGTSRQHVEDELMYVPHGLTKPKSSFGKTDYWSMIGRQYYVPNTDTDGATTTTDTQVMAAVEAMNGTHNTLLYRDPRGRSMYVLLKVPNEEMADNLHTRLIFDLVETLYTGSIPVA